MECRADAVVLVLYEVQQTWAGSLHRRKDTCVVKALALTAAGKMQPVLWSAQRLPSDCFSVTAVPNGGAIILSPALVIYQNKVSVPPCPPHNLAARPLPPAPIRMYVWPSAVTYNRAHLP